MRRLFDRGLALRIARTAIGTGPETTPAERAEVGASVRAACARADAAVRDLTGWHDAPATPVAEVVNRSAWVDANLASIEPLLLRAAESLAAPKGGALAVRAVASTQLGLVFGYLSRKVIGQYDLFGGERILFVGPNVVEVERRAGVNPDDFRLWIALHELTHRLQFSGAPWLRPRLESIIDRSLTLVGPKMPSLGDLVAGVRASIAQGTPIAGIADLILTPEQRAILADAQALMSSVEGHASWVMDEAGRVLIDDVAGLRARVEGARGRPIGPERAFQTAIGLDAKRKQYAHGQAFFDAVARRGGPEAVRLAWQSADTLPTREELGKPDSWWQRVVDPGGS